MSNTRDWNDAFIELKRRAESMRGFVELQPDSPAAIRWPRTIGADVIAIAAVIDPHVQDFGSAATCRRWRACMADVARYAIPAPGETYAGNRAFWSCLVNACVYLASIEAPLPDTATWQALLDGLGQVLALRNIGPSGDTPFKRFDGVRTFDELYVAQLKFLRAERGADMLGPETGMSGGERSIPRTTNADVIALADYWSKQLSGVKKVFGHDEAVRRWKLATAEVDQLARPGDPSAPYSRNNHFWRQLSHIATHVAVADEAPSKWDMAVDSVKDSVKNLPENVVAGVKTIAGGVGDVASDFAHGVGRVANSAGKGLFSGFGTPLLIGGGLLGLFLISRARSAREKSRE